jgi:hypothetical protein
MSLIKICKMAVEIFFAGLLSPRAPKQFSSPNFLLNCKKREGK